MEERKVSKRRQEIIYNLGIYELRALARELGVNAPTAKKKSRTN